MFKNLFYGVLHYSGARNLIKCALKNPHCAILAYHRISPISDENSLLRDTIVEPDKFEKQIIYLRNKYNVISLNKLLESHSEGAFFPANSAIVTFDDGYEDNYRYAFPILRKHDIPATIFVSTAFVNGAYNSWWEKLRNITINTRKNSLLFKYKTHIFDFRLDRKSGKEGFFEAMSALFKEANEIEEEKLLNLLSDLLEVNDECVYPRALSWNQMKEMLRSGVDFGAHTHKHRSLSVLDNNDLAVEISKPKKVLEENLGREIFSFAFPYGKAENLNKHALEVIKSSGYKIALTMTQGLVFKDDSLFSLRRIGVGGNDTEAVFKLKVDGLVSWISGNFKG